MVRVVESTEESCVLWDTGPDWSAGWEEDGLIKTAAWEDQGELTSVHGGPSKSRHQIFEDSSCSTATTKIGEMYGRRRDMVERDETDRSNLGGFSDQHARAPKLGTSPIAIAPARACADLRGSVGIPNAAQARADPGDELSRGRGGQ